MRPTKLLGLMALALIAFGAIGTSMASAVEAEEENKPQILCFVENCIKELKAELTGGASTLETLGGLKLRATSVIATAKECEETKESKGKDGTLCKDADILFLGVEKEGAKCSTEGLSAEKGEVLALLDLHLSAGLNEAKELVPLILAKVLSKALAAELVIKCGVLKELVKGTISCAGTPGLVKIPTTTSVAVLCKANATTHDREGVIKCTVLCTENEKDPFEVKLGTNFEDAAMAFHVEGRLNKEIYIDD